MTPLVVRIDRLAVGGEGVGRLPDGRVVFVPRTAAGDLVELETLREHRRFARARPRQILEEGPGRVPPPCPHYLADWCGGCQLQHLEREFQRAARRGFVGDALRRIAKRAVPDPPLEPAATEWHYRTRLTLHQSADGRHIGFHRRGRPGDIFDLQTCLLADRSLLGLWAALSPRRDLLPRRFEAVTLRLAPGGQRHVIVHGAEDVPWPNPRALAEALVAVGESATLWWHPPGGAARVVGGGEAYPATVFEQVNPEMGQLVRRYAVAALGDLAGQHAWDLYAGIGETTGMLVAGGATVESVEVDPRAVGLSTPEAGDSPNVQRHTGRAEELMQRLGPPALVITNPPRGGMESPVIDAIAAARPTRVVYISCDPATLARDLARFGESWSLADVRAFDLFPQTAHVETVVVLEPVP